MRVPAARVLLVLTVAVALAACGDGGSGSTSGSRPVSRTALTTAVARSTAVTSAATSVPTSAPSSAAASTAAPPQRIAVKGALTDPDTGDTVKATSVVRRFPLPVGYYQPVPIGEVVLVQLTVVVDVKYYASFDTAVLTVVPDYSTDAPDITGSLRTAMGQAGYPPLSTNRLPAGGTATGWLAFRLDLADSATLTLRYARPGFQVTNTATVVAPKTIDVPLIR